MKELITAETIKDARKAGVQHVFVTPGALITPQARDDAKEYGIAFVPRGVGVGAGVVAPERAAPIQPACQAHAYQAHAYQAPAYNAPVSYGHASPYALRSAQHAHPMHAYAHPIQNRDVMNNTYASSSQPPLQVQEQSVLDAATQRLVEQVLAAVVGAASAGTTQPCVTHPQVNPPVLAPVNAQAQSMPACQKHEQGHGPASVTAAVMQKLNGLLANQGGVGAFPGIEGLIASVVADVASVAHVPSVASVTPHTAPNQHAVPTHMAGVDFATFTAQPNPSSVQGEVSIEEALLAHDAAAGPGITRFSFADTSLVWTFTHHEVLVVTHGTIEVKANVHGAGTVLAQGSAMRVAPGTSLTLVAHGSASCVCVVWPSK